MTASALSRASKRRGRRRPSRSGSILVLTAILLVLILFCVAFVVDLGYARLARAELQRSADAAAMAGAWELLDENRLRAGVVRNDDAMFENARAEAARYAGLNRVAGSSPLVNRNSGNSDPNGDVVIGYCNDSRDRSRPLVYNNPSRYNTVSVRVRRMAEQNGMVPFSFARVFGFQGAPVAAQAAATFDDRVIGFRAPEPARRNVSLLPFTLHIDTWTALLAGAGRDEWRYDETTRRVSCGSDGILETNLFPIGSGPGNFGTVDIGTASNSTAELRRQIRDGISAADLAHHGGELKLNPVTGTLSLGGDPGISAGMTDAVQAIIGQPRTIPLYSSATGQGNNLAYTIVAFAGVRVADVNLTGSNKHITIQPGVVVDDSVITGPGPHSSYYVYDRVRLSR